MLEGVNAYKVALADPKRIVPMRKEDEPTSLLRDQHAVMAREMVDLAKTKRLPHAALDAIAARFEA